MKDDKQYRQRIFIHTDALDAADHILIRMSKYSPDQHSRFIREVVKELVERTDESSIYIKEP